MLRLSALLALGACAPAVAPPPALPPSPPLRPIPIAPGAPAGALETGAGDPEPETADAASLAAATSRMGPKFRVCYTRSLRSTPTLEGRVTFDVMVGARGEVISAHARRSTLPPDLVLCLERVVRGGPFAPPESPPARVSIPIRLALP